MSQDLLVARAGRVLTLTLNRPAARNAVTAGMLAGLAEAVAKVGDAAVVLLRGAGPAFCAGADIAGYDGAPADRLEEFTRTARGLCDAIAALDAVVVAQVHGACLGGGLELALAADLVIAADDARLGLPEVRLGLIPGWGGTQRLTRAVGPAVARALILTADLITGARARELGLVARAVPAGELEDVTATLVAGLAAGPTRALAAAKRAIVAAGGPDGAEVETAGLLEAFATADGREGVAAFVAKRPAVFVGA